MSFSTAPKKSSQSNDKSFPVTATDGISSVAINGFNNQPSNIAIVTSWDNSVICHEIQQQTGQIVVQGKITHDAPVLCSDFNSQDNMTVYSGSCDGVVKKWTVTEGVGAAVQIGKHDAAVKDVKFQPEQNTVISSSWDKTLKIWDTRQPTPAATIQLNERVYAMDSKKHALVAVTADKMVHVFDLGQQKLISEFKSTLNHQVRCVSLFADNQGFAMGSIEGRIAIEYFDELQYKTPNGTPNPVTHKPKSENFAFKCHRDGTDIFAVNAIHFSHQNTFVSAGSDGVLSFWDKQARYKLANLDEIKKVNKCPINDAKFSPDGKFLIYAASYDWSKGAEHNDPNKFGYNVYLHQVQPVEIMPKQ